MTATQQSAPLPNGGKPFCSIQHEITAECDEVVSYLMCDIGEHPPGTPHHDPGDDLWWLDAEYAALPLEARAPEVAELADVLEHFTVGEIRCLMRTAGEIVGARYDRHDLSERQITLSEKAWIDFASMD